jgi:YidC/Oxa1 family membrane protein insertase
MEQGRLFIAIALSFLVFVVWEYVFVGKQEIMPPAGSEKIAEAPVTDRQVKEFARIEQEAASAIGEAVEAPGTVFNALTIKTPLYSAKISEKGAAIVSFLLKDYKESIEQDSENKELISPDNREGTALLRFSEGSAYQIENALYTTDFSGESLTVNDAEQSVSFFWKSSTGLMVEKRFSFYPDSYKIKMDVFLNNMSDQSFKDGLIFYK